MQMSAKTNKKRLNELLETVLNRNGVKYNVRIVLATFCVMWHINDLMRLSNNTMREFKSFAEPWETNKQLLQRESPVSTKNLDTL